MHKESDRERDGESTKIESTKRELERESRKIERELRES